MFDITGKRRQQAAGIAAGWFDLDYIGAKIGQPTRGVSGGNVTELDNAEVTKG
jgi:hypothetical protein